MAALLHDLIEDRNTPRRSSGQSAAAGDAAELRKAVKIFRSWRLDSSHLRVSLSDDERSAVVHSGEVTDYSLAIKGRISRDG